VTGGIRGRQRRKVFIWVDTMLGNVKNAMQGTYHAIRAKHLPRYIAEFTYRFNRRFDLAGMVESLGTAALLMPPIPDRFVNWLAFIGNQLLCWHPRSRRMAYWRW